MVKKRTIYTASDGKEFDNEKEAEEHDKKVIRESIKVYKVYYNPDLNEGRGYGDHGYVYVHANKYHEQFLEYFLGGNGAGYTKFEIVGEEEFVRRSRDVSGTEFKVFKNKSRKTAKRIGADIKCQQGNHGKV